MLNKSTNNMNPPPFESKHTYYGDQWLEFHDFLNGITDREGIFLEMSLQLQLINPRELAYKNGHKDEMLKRIKCLIEMNREPDSSKHSKILEKWGYNELSMSKNPSNENISGIM